MILKSTEDIMAALERGQLSRDFAEAVGKVSEALEAAEEGAAGITIKLKFKAKNEVVSIRSSITTTLPEKKRRETMLFLADGALSLQHPDQIDIFSGDGDRPARGKRSSISAADALYLPLTPETPHQPTNAVTAEAVNAIRDLVKKDHVAVELLALPTEAIGLGRYVEKPHVAIIRKGDSVEIQSLASHIEAVRGKPLARRGTANATSLASFIALVNRHKVEEESVVFANTDWRKPSLTAVIDYHVAAEIEDKDIDAFEDAGARNGKHRVHYAYPLSDPWKAWVEANGRKMNQADFAAFLEEHITELAAPTDAERIKWEADFKAKFATPAELLDLSRGLEVTVGAKVKNRTKLQTGETQMFFEVEYADANGGELVVPGLFLLCVAPFHRGDVIRIPVRLRFRAGGADIVWFFEMVRPDLFIDERLKDDAAEVNAATGLAVIDGTPEMPA